jgi:cell division protease FtsH
MTSGMVCADLANLINEAALLAVRRNKKKVGMPEFEEAAKIIKTKGLPGLR